MSMMTLPHPLPLVGRTTELAELEALLEVGNADSPVAFLRGEGGVGKSRLAEELAARAVRRSWRVVRGRAYPAETGIPYAPFSDAWLPLLRELDPAALDVLSRGGRAELRLLFPALAVGSSDDEPHATGEPDELRTRLMWTFAEFVKRFAARTPLLCILEDLQWADDSSLNLIHFLARQAGQSQVRFVLSYNEQERDGNPQLIETERSLEALRLARVLRLDPLSLEHVRELVARSFGSDAETVRSFSAVVYGWTRGNAFFLEEVLKSLVESDKLRGKTGGWVGWDSKDLELPASIRDAVIGRTRSLTAGARAIARLAAIVGSRVSHGLLVSMSDLSDDELLRGLEELCRRGILDESTESDEVVYHFTHPLVRESLYGELGLARARREHARVAAAMEAYYGADAEDHADELAFHYAHTGAAEGLKAARYLTAAGLKALERRADREAINYLESALERAGDEARNGAPSRTDLGPPLARAYTRVGDFEAAVQHWEAALAVTPPDHVRSTDARRALGMTYFWLGRHTTAHRHFDEGLRVAAANGDQSATVRLLVAKAHCLHELGRGTEALETLRPALPLAERIGDPRLLARVHRALALLHVWIGPPSAAEAHAERAIELATRVGDVSIEFWARWGLAVLWGMRGDTARMTETIEQVDALADRARSPVLRLWTADMVVELAYGRGEWDRGVEAGEQAIALARSLNQRTMLPRLLVWTSQFFTARGEHDRAAELVGEAAEISGLDRETGPDNVHQVVPTYIGMAHYLLGIGQYQEAIEAAERGREIAAGTGYTLWAVHQLLPVLVEAYLRTDDVERAAAAGAELRAHSERIDHPLGLAWAEACEALVRWRRGDAEGAIPGMRAAAERLEAIPMVWYATRLRRHLSARLRDAGRIDEAKAELDRVWEVCVRIRAGTVKEKARQNYLDMGLKPPVEPRSQGWRGLTPEEIEVAKLAARGMTNKAIAKARGSAPSTVGRHLYNIYRKLDVGGPGARGRLAAMVRDDGLLESRSLSAPRG